MNVIFEWLSENWLAVAVPLAVFMATLIATLWLRTYSYRVMNRWVSQIEWPANKILVEGTRFPSVLWCLFISAGLAITVSKIPVGWKNPINNGMWTLLLISITLTLLNILGNLITYFSPKLKIPENFTTVIRNGSRVIILLIAILVLLGIWSVPTAPVLLLIAVIIVVVMLALRDVFPNIVAGFQINAAGHIKKGDYVKLGTGEEGYISEIDWRSTHIRTLEENTVILPNSHLVRSSIINYGHPLKQAQEPFRFYTRVHLTELTGMKAMSLRELVDILRTSSDAIVYFHTHHFLEQHHFLTPEPASDFALWVTEALGDEALGERLVSVDTFSFSDLKSLRDRIVGIIDESLTRTAENREAMPGREFYFMKSVVMVLPTPYVAHDLRGLAECLRQLSLGSIYFHIFESRLRLGKGLNDFTVWLRDNLGEVELGEEIGRLDPYTYTLEGLRSQLIQMIEKRIK
jgi:hypothetical protein